MSGFHRIGFALVCLARALHAAEPYPVFYESAATFLPAIVAAEKDVRPLDQPVTGVTVPHHLLAADMMAATLRLAAKNRYRRILVISPDHFRRGTTLCSTTRRPFRSPFGNVPVDEAAVGRLLGSPLVSESNLFSHEHGVQAMIPFLARWFPGTPIVPLALDISAPSATWGDLLPVIAPLVGRDTLIVQSTDFSHYLTQAVAATKDQETLRVLACGDREGITKLKQPAHLDSRAAQWLQMSLQRQVFGCAAPVVVDNRNAIRYGGRPDEPSTTSYITQIYSPEFIPAAALPGDAWFFGGDTQFGRGVAKAYADPEKARRIRESILKVTGSRPLIVNLEGVVLDEKPAVEKHPMRIGMAAALTLAELKNLHVAAVSVANNHTLDYGVAARAHMIATLSAAGITVADAGGPVPFGPFDLAVASDVTNSPEPASDLLNESYFAAWQPHTPGKPLFAFLHAGVEYRDAPGKRERTLADWAEQAGATLVIGCHPHRPSPGWERTEKSLRFPSLGNLIFDQTDPRNGGGLVEIRFFEQGTWAARWIPLGNLYAGPAR